MSRELRQQKIPVFKYLHTGTKPKDKSCGEKICANRIVDINTEREIDGFSVPETYLVSEFSSVQSDTSSQSQVSQSSNNINKDLLRPNIPINLPEGPPTRSPLPIGNWNTDPNSANCSFSFNPINPVGIVPIRPPVREAVIKNNPSARKCRSAPNSPLRRRHLKTASPLIGISSLGVLDKQLSNSSLDWDGLTNTPSFYRRPSPISVLSTPSTSLDSIPINSPMPGVSSLFNTPGSHHNLNMAPTES